MLAPLIDHTLLSPEATTDEVAALIAEADRLGCYAVCISPVHLPVAVPSGLHVATVVGFPSGAVPSLVKATEAAWAVAHGADEVDMVIPVGAAVTGDFSAVEADIRTVREAVPTATLKVILETAVLDDAQIIAGCTAAANAGADFVKTSTGFHPAGGATVHAVELMKQTVGDRLQVKAAGGIRTAAAAQAMVAAGATRLGLSRTATILAELR
ncbi:MAG: deoxyribose-phosphate aldolase [Corynebacterium sp.]|nr:deoxyribose-phosphate aldolase [Corynebacterium sp.]